LACQAFVLGCSTGPLRWHCAARSFNIRRNCRPRTAILERQCGFANDRRGMEKTSASTTLFDRVRACAAGLLAAPAAALALFVAAAQSGYPNRPVRIIVPYGAGGVADLTMRIVADRLSEKLGQQFIIDNRPGAGGIVAAKAAAAAAPDGYVLHLTSNGTAVSAALFRQLPYDVLHDFTPITITAFFDLVVATRTNGPLQTIADIVAAARANPGKLNFGTIAPGSTQHLSAELFKSVADIDVAIVTYRTTPELVTGLLRGDVQVGFDYYAGLNAAVREGRLKAAAVTGARRTPALSAVPTVAESGLPAYVVESWNALSGPGGMSDDLVRFLNRTVNDVLRLPEVQEKAMLFGMEARGTTPEELQDRMKADIAKWAAVIAKAGIERQ
jgi:tripartite-type tricarboxylate transporter receptor subunit TctC